MAKRRGVSRSRPVAIDLFCGAGGMSLGFEQAGFDIVLAIDVDGHHIAAHARNFPKSATLCKSLVEVTADDVYLALGRKIEVDLVFGGPPCQGFSHMGLRDSFDPRNTLIDQFARVVAELQPRAFVMENVAGMLSGSTRSIVDRNLAFLKDAGFRINEPVRILDASDFGVPQKRKRLFVLGIRRDVAGWLPYPNGPSPGQPLRPTVWDAIGDLPSIEGREELFSQDSESYDRSPKSDYARVARGLMNDPSDYSYLRKWQSNRCTGCLRIRHTSKAVELYAATAPGRTVPGHKLPRLDPNGVCPTLRAGSDSTHGSYTAPRPIHPFEPRCITSREAARLHGFPDWFAFYPLKWHAYRQIGNAVCPPVARAIGREVMKALGCKARRPARVLDVKDIFVLPQDRSRTLKRIPHIQNYPPVVDYLFHRAFDKSTGKLRRSRFTFGNVQEAITATGVNLAWTRADTFVQEIARSRNIGRILKLCLTHGYSLRAIKDPQFIGEFVPRNLPGTIEQKDSIHVKSRDVADALVLSPALSVRTEDTRTFVSLLAEKAVVESLWGKANVCIEVGNEIDDFRNGLRWDYCKRNGKGMIGRGCVVVSPAGNLPNRSRIGRIARMADADEIVVITPITGRHVLATRFNGCLESPREARRKVYDIAPNRVIAGKEADL